MKDVVLVKAKSTQVKKYKCPYCEGRFERKKLHIHIQNEHEELIPEGYTALRIAFNTINKKEVGHCIICKSETAWNEDKGRYERLCDKQECHEVYKKMTEERTKKKYGTERLQSDPRYAEEIQKKALNGRSISGKYTFKDGGIINYVGKYEKKFLEFCDLVMNMESSDFQEPGPSIEYFWEGNKHLYIPDFYYIPYNLIIEIKDGGDNPNKNPEMQVYKTDRQKSKEDAVRATQKYNYIRLTNNNFAQFMSIMAEIKYQMKDDCYDPIMMINECAGLRAESSVYDEWFGVIDESKDESHLDKNHKTKSGVSFKYLSLDDALKDKAIRNDEKIYKNIEWYSKKKDGIVAIDSSANKIAGYICVTKKDKKEYGGKVLSPLFVYEEYRGYGLSNKLMSDCISKWDPVALGVYSDNEVAINLYKKYGFEISKTRTDKEYYYMYLKKNRVSINESTFSKDIDTIVFDFGGVLIQTSKNAEEKVWKWAKDHGIEHDEMINELIMKYYNAVQYDENASEEECKKRFRKIVKPEYRKYTDEIFYLMDFDKSVCEYTIPMLESLKKKGYKLYYLSNVHHYSWVKRKESGLLDFVDKYFIGGIYSWETGIQKPDLEIYRMLTDKYNLIPKNCLFVDDKEKNVVSAESIGFNGLVWERTNPKVSLKEINKLKKINIINESALRF